MIVIPPIASSKMRVIGIAGASNGGKTTICNNIKSSEGWDKCYHIIHMDDYYWVRFSPYSTERQFT
ncbi:hypothetical protein Ciccas_001606 [Cichlidogyrus casuarinus]|uniref:Uncharacterized protein n=1 Tax=Cichlidogyrus casuarinus TaxID=1844966 RepID=A0ABD2QLY3_9PLAT